MIVPEEQLVKDVVGDWQLDADRKTLADGQEEKNEVNENPEDLELQGVLVTDMLDVDERDCESDGDVVKVSDTVGLLEVQKVTLGEGELVKHSVGEPVWVEEGLTDTVLQCVPDTLLHPDKVELAHWLTL